MAISDADLERLSQLLDGELNTAEVQRMQRRLAEEPALAATWRDLQALDVELRQACAGHGSTRVPDDIRALLSEGSVRDNVVPLFPRRALWPMALAASLVLAVAIALVPLGTSDVPRQSVATLASALEANASGDSWYPLDGGRQMQAVLTFKNHNGDWCREFLLRRSDNASAQRGVACRQEEQWRTEVLASGAAPGSPAAYRPAAAGDRDAVQQFMRDHAADIALDARQEEKLINNAWR
ncbi:MAG: hypothetical protein ABR578_10330 [Chromatocurvus sp.]